MALRSKNLLLIYHPKTQRLMDLGMGMSVGMLLWALSSKLKSLSGLAWFPRVILNGWAHDYGLWNVKTIMPYLPWIQLEMEDPVYVAVSFQVQLDV
jgi:hypothetical protein